MAIPDFGEPPPEAAKPKKKRGGRSLKDAIAAPPPRPTLDAFLDHFFALAGGPAKVAKMLFDEFQSAGAGTLIRQRVLESVLRNLKGADAKGSPLDDMGVLTEADLDKLIDTKLARFAGPESPDAPAGP